MEKLKLPVEFIKENQIIPVDKETVYITEKTPFYAIEDIRYLLGKPPKTILISENEFIEKLEEYISEISNELKTEEKEEESFFENLLESSDSPIIQTINSIFLKAIRGNVSDIHFEPYSNKVIVRFRLDGVLHEVNSLAKNVYPQIVSRIKIISKLNVAEKRLPQDGRIRVKISNKEIDMRVSTLPTVFGERIVIRLLDKSNKILTLDELGFSSDDKNLYESLIKKPYGLILITGPTGSGKSTTLYASLLKLKTPQKNILTIEDPVEYQIDGIGQIQVNPNINLTFANGLRSILRQDPDIIMVGEIRDKETAEIAIHASMTGHLVLSTLHTNDAPSASARLIDMGVEPFLIASSLEGVIAQRLVRRVCNNCKVERELTNAEIEEIIKYYPTYLVNLAINGSYDIKLLLPEIYNEGIKEREDLIKLKIDLLEEDISDKVLSIYKRDYRKFLKRKKVAYGIGCNECLNTGFKGRIAIYEILKLDEELKGLISKNVETNIMRKRAIKKGMKTLVQDGIEKVLEKITTLEEVLQVAQV